MASEGRSPPRDLSWLERLARDPGSFDFHAALRRFEASFPEGPRLGEAVRPTEEPVRVGQTPSLSFEPSAVAEYTPAADGARARMLVGFVGLWGPQGPLPIHMTEHARERLRHAGDRTLTSFVDIFHHRMLLLFHRAWAASQPTAALDRPEDDAFARYVGALLGIALPSNRGRDAFPDRAKMFFAGRFAGAARNADGLADVVSEYFGAPAAIEEFFGEWVELPKEGRWQLGASPATSVIARTAILGSRVWTRTHKFRIVLGPLQPRAFRRMLPQGGGVEELAALVRLYTNDEWDWDLRLVLTEDAGGRMVLGKGARLGWTSRIGRERGNREDLVVDPVRQRTSRVASDPQ
jgi:type VI secretion system protein ImpH